MQMRDRFLATIIRSLDTHNVVARPGKAMLCYRIPILRQGIDIAVGFHCHLLAAIAEVPRLITRSGAKRPHLKGHGFARANVHRRRESGMDRGWQQVGCGFVDDQHDREIVIDVTAHISNFEDFAVLSGLRIGAFDRGTARAASVREHPVVTRNFAGSAPGL